MLLLLSEFCVDLFCYARLLKRNYVVQRSTNLVIGHVILRDRELKF